MPNSVKVSGRFSLKSLSACAPQALLGFLAMGIFMPAAAAQTAPQLLPYTSRLIAGSGTAAIAKGSACPVSGFIATDAFGDGCLATEILIAPTTTSGSGPRYAIADKTGAVFFSDGTNGLVRRVDPITGIVTAVAGGAASSPATGTACGTNLSLDSDGDGCLANLVHLSHPMGLAFDALGNLFFVDEGFDEVRKIAATGGVITTTGIITRIAGGSTFGYNVNNTSLTGPVIAATQSLLNFPYGLAFDAAGNLYIGDEGNNAIEVVNMGLTTATIQGQVIPPGTIAKFAGYGNLQAKTPQSGDCPDYIATPAVVRGGCYFGKWTDGALANVSNIDAVYSIAVDSTGNVYLGNEFNDNVGVITPANVISNYAGIQGTVLKKIQRGPAGSFAIGSTFGIAVDVDKNVYVTDASSGVVWRVDGAGKSMYVVAGGATTTCSAATDTFGDGCPATQATFGSSGTTFASTALPGPGIFGVTVDAYSDLFVGDTETGVIREIASGTQFGNVGANQPIDIVDIHFAAGDSPAAGAYTLTSGASNFSLGTATCTANSDSTTDCLLPITATPTVLGTFTGTLTVKSTLGATANFPLSGNFIQSPLTRTTVGYNVAAGCAGTTTFPTTTPITLSASLVANGPSAPTGTITFFANGTQIGTPQNVTNIGTTTSPVYGATLVNTFSTTGTYTITANYSGDTYFKPSSGKTAGSITTSAPTFSTSVLPYQQATVASGQTGLYSFTVTQSVYTGTITFACSGLPANSSCVFNPPSITATGCSTVSTVALSIVTQQRGQLLAGFAAGHGLWQLASVLLGLGLALVIGLRRRRHGLPYAHLWMALALLLASSGIVACGKGANTLTGTPAGTYTVTVTSSGSTGTNTTFTVPLTVN